MATQTADEKKLAGHQAQRRRIWCAQNPQDPLDGARREKIRALLEKDGVSPEVGGLRVGVQGGGCSGLSYAMRLDTQARDRDKVFEEFGAKLFVDPKSFLYLNGTTLEYEETLMRQGFVFQNPNAARNCGCGSSFTA